MSARRPAPPRRRTERLLGLYRASDALVTGSHRALLSLHSVARAVVAGVWLGVLDREELTAIGDAFYAGHERYSDDDYNLSGLWAWERAALDAHFAGRHRLLLVGAGAGREVIALAKDGFEVHGFECNRALVASANRYLGEGGLNARVDPSPPDVCPRAGGEFDGLIVGWGAYMLVAGRSRRIELLRSMRDQASADAPLLLSFFVRPARAPRYGIVRTIGSAVRRARGRDPIELGDDLEPEYVHYFDRAEIEDELAAAGFELRTFETQPYGHAVAVAR